MSSSSDNDDWGDDGGAWGDIGGGGVPPPNSPLRPPRGNQFMPEANVYDRAGFGGAAAILGGNIFEGNLNEMQKKINRMLQEPDERFAVYVDATVRHLNNYDGIDISENSIVKMLETIRILKHVEHKNPAAYVLGYIASQGGVNIDKKAVETAFKVGLPHVDGVIEADVIRYARLWMELRKK